MSQMAADRLMDRATGALEATRYFEAERLCVRALLQAHARGDYERMARILLPLQESRRQVRQLAVDSRTVHVTSAVSGRSLLRGGLSTGCWLIGPPCVAADARKVRERAGRSQLPVFVLAREPTTRAGQWPLAAFSPGVGGGPGVTVRCRVAPPAGDPDIDWFEAVGEALGDAAIVGVPEDLHPAWRVDDMLARLDACPDHEKLHQRLAEACRAAAAAGPPAARRPRPLMDDPFRF